MKRTIISSCLFPLILAASMASTSCIFDSPQGDDFYRTLWESDEVPLGPFKVSTMTLEFLCNDGVSICLDDDFAVFGTYESNSGTATFANLEVLFENDGNLKDAGKGVAGKEGIGDDGSDAGQNLDITVTFIEAHRNGNTLFLLWRVQNAVYPFTTALHRVTEQDI